MHHIISDGWSLGVFVRELGILYQAFSNGHPSPLPELPIQYKDYARWRQEQCQGVNLGNLTSYWGRQLEGAPPGIHLMTDRTPSASLSDDGARFTLPLPGQLVEDLKRLNALHGVTLFMTLLTAFLALLHRRTGQEDLVVGTAMADRERPETHGLIWFLVNNLVLRVDAGGNPTMCELLARVREMSIGAHEHRDLPFDMLVQALQPDRTPGYHPLTQVLFAFLNMPLPPLTYPGLSVTLLDIDTGIAPADLSIQFFEKAGGLEFTLVYKTDLFEKDTIERFAHELLGVLQSFVHDTGQRLADLPVVTEAGRQQLLVDWNDTAMAFPSHDPVQRLFEEQVAKAPEAAAVVTSGECLSYRELNRRANSLARLLHTKGVGPETVVALCVQRSPEMVAALIGILKSGGAYLPIDPAYPGERKLFMLEDSGARLVLTQDALAGGLSGFTGEILCLDGLASAPDGGSDGMVTGAVTPSDLAYVIYTSGSMGTPKGVMVEHHSLTNFVQAMIGLYRLESSQRQLQFVSLGFDMSVEEIFPPLCSGASIALHPGPADYSALETLEVCERLGVTMINLPASFWHQMVDELVAARRTVPECIRVLKTGVEPPSPERFAQWEKLVRHPVRFFNGYGPTEATVLTTSYEVPMHSGALAGKRSIPIGRPLPNTQVYLLDARHRLVPIGSPGELYIGGAGLARGYRGKPELTEASFIANPFTSNPDQRLYRTGDLARYLSGGTLEFLGRVDRQIKIRGFRIELGEIEATLRLHPAVRDVVVTARAGAPEQQRIVAFVVPNRTWSEGGAPGPEHLQAAPALRSFLAARLPHYMIPSQFVVLESFPCTAHGKIDLEALPEPDNRRPELADAYRAPRTDTETRLAAIFGDLLGVEKIGIDDNFFALGGHSLLVIKVVHRVNESLGTAVPVRALFESPTVSQLAKRIDEFKSGKTLSLSAAGHEVEPLVPMQADRAPCSLFCFHHVGGQIHSYAHLASALRGTCQVYGIQSRAVADPSREHHSLDAMVDDYVNVLVHHQQTGPFFLLGYSTAGILTMAVAHALERAGRTVDLVVLLDPTSPSGQIPQIDNDQLPAIVMSLRASFGNEMASITQDEERLFREGARINERLAALPEEERAGLFSRWLQTMSLPQEEAREILNRRLDLIKRHYELLKSYRPSQIQAPMFICWPAKSLTGPHAERFAWETCTKGPVHTETIDADHFGMVRPPSEQVLARRLSEYMTASRIQAESPLP